MSGAERIAAERQRQIEVEGYDAKHDDGYADGSDLLAAASEYLSHVGHIGVWPWKSQYWKPSTDPIRNLEKAGALIAAEIDRLLRRRTT